MFTALGGPDLLTWMATWGTPLAFGACTAIPLGARIVAACDSFASMVSDRVYRRGMAAEALAELQPLR